MKTSVSIPDETFAEVERKAKDLGMSRSEFFTTAAKRYLDELVDDNDPLVAQINAAIALTGPDEDTAWVVEAGKRMLAKMGDEWDDEW